MTINKDFKKCIEKIKFEFSITQKEIAQKLGVHNTYLSDMIHQRVPVSEKITHRIYELFHIAFIPDNQITDTGKQLESYPNSEEISHSSEPKLNFYTCPDCIQREKTITDLRANIADLRKHIDYLEFCLGKRKKAGSE